MPLRHHQLLLQYQEFHDQETIHLLHLKEWAFHVRWHDQETIHSMQLKVWHDQARQDQVHQDQVQDLKVEHRQDPEQDLPVEAVLVQDLVEQSQDLVEVLLLEDSQVEDLLVVAVAA